MSKSEFQSTPPMRGATASGWSTHMTATFQSTPPMRGATRRVWWLFRPQCHFNPRPPCGERRLFTAAPCPAPHISIHAPHAGSDYRRSAQTAGRRDFNPRPPCGERHRPAGASRPIVAHFNPRPPCGERLGVSGGFFGHNVISIHAPHAGSDLHLLIHFQKTHYFNPRPPCGERHG